jgi:hypothetical protein
MCLDIQTGHKSDIGRSQGPGSSFFSFYRSRIEENLLVQVSEMNNSRTIEKILAETKTIAVVGFSASQSRAGYYVSAYLKEQGYRIIPVNPHIQAGVGEKAYPNLSDLSLKL